VHATATTAIAKATAHTDDDDVDDDGEDDHHQ
jgi:hypothetical protein